ncbi:MAG: hypothetical protein ACYTFG_15675, partial [Planctomycetota bacterium]
IIPALESAHALARAADVAKEVGKGGAIVVNLSGRGDKDLHTIDEITGKVGKEVTRVVDPA